MNFFTSTRRASHPGTARYARELASVMRHGVCLGVTDARIVEAALRSGAARGIRRVAAGLAAAGLLAIPLIVGIEDRNGDGRIDLADVKIGLQSAITLSKTPMALITERRR